MGSPLRISLPKDGDWNSLRRCLSILSGNLGLGIGASPTFTSLTLSGLTASRLLSTDSGKTLTSTNLISWVAGTTNQVNVADDGDGSITLSTPQDIATSSSPTFSSINITNDAIIGGVCRATNFARTGWPLVPGVTLSFDNGTRTFTVTDGGSAYYYIDGIKYTLGGNKSVVIDNTEGLWFIYFIGDTLTASQTPWSISAADKAFVAVVYWDATNSKEILLGYELHGFVMDAATHNRLHHGGGSAWESGLLVSDTGSETVNVSAGEFHDEDIEISISNGAGGSLFEQVLSPAELPVYYRSGASAWRRIETASKNNATDVGYVATTDLQYNKLNGTWALANVTSANHVAYYVIATNDIDEPVVLVMGQREDVTIASAKENNLFSGLSLAGFPFVEAIIVARLILKEAAGGVYYTLEDIVDLRYANAEGNVTSPLITDHGGLGGLGDDDHVQYLLVDGSRAMSGNLDLGTNNLVNPGTGHDAFTDFVSNEHIDHSTISVLAGTGMSGGGTIDGNVTLNCDITQYTDEDAQDAVGGILDDGTVGNIVFTYNDVGNVISAVTQDAEIDHNSLNNTHNLTTDIDHDATTNFVPNEHIDHTSVTVSAGTGLTGGGDISANRSLSLSHLGIESLTDPNADRIMFWDDSTGAMAWLTLGTNLSITDTTINASGSGDTIQDADTDTYVTVESGSDNDEIEGYCAGTKTFEISAVGIHSLPQTSACSVIRSTDQTITTGAWTRINYDTETYDRRGEWDNATNYRFTATEDGLYVITGMTFFEITSPSIGDLYGSAIYVNGALNRISMALQIENTSSTFAYLAISETIPLTAGQYLEIRYYSDFSGNIGGGYTHAQITKIA